MLANPTNKGHMDCYIPYANKPNDMASLKDAVVYSRGMEAFIKNIQSTTWFA